MSYQSPLDFEFIRIPLPIQNRKNDIPYSAMMLYGYLAKMHFTNVDGYIPIKNKQAAKDIKLSEKTVKEGFNILSGYGLVDSKKMGRIKGYKLMPINPEGYPEIIPDYKRPKKSKPKFLDKKQPSTRGVLNPDKDNRAPGGCYIPSTRGVLHTEHQGGASSADLPIIEESFKEFFKDATPGAVFFENYKEKYDKKHPRGIVGNFRKEDLDRYYLEYGDEFLDVCRRSEEQPLAKRAQYIQKALNNIKNAFQMKYEELEKQKSDEYKMDLIPASKNLNELNSGIGRAI